MAATDSTIDIPRLLASASLSHVHYLPETDSTNAVAMQRAAEVAPGQAELVLTSNQLKGKGRGDNRWFSNEGSLTFSLITRELPISPGQTPRVSLAAGLAACQAIEAHTPGGQARLKWPNDVYVNSRKACGVLIEVPGPQAARFVIGVGVNVNNSLAGAPQEVADRAISLIDVTGRPVSPTNLLIDFLKQLDGGLAMLAANDPLLPGLWRDYSLLTGRRVRLALPKGPLEGVCQGIAEDGALLLETAHALVPCYGGVVEEFD